jgi:hypothetical protein
MFLFSILLEITIIRMFKYKIKKSNLIIIANSNCLSVENFIEFAFTGCFSVNLALLVADTERFIKLNKA